jgi:predicted XRE-type DNA-binding protein
VTQYRDIAGLEGYRVGDDGTVWSRHRARRRFSGDWRQMKQRLRPGTTPYLIICLRADAGCGKVVTAYIHVLVLTAFVGPRPKGMHGCHNDGDVFNNRLGNLRWDTPKANAADKYKHGTQPHGSKTWNAIHTEADIAEVFRLRSRGLSQKAIGHRLGFGQSEVSAILLGKTWPLAERPDVQLPPMPLNMKITTDDVKAIFELRRAGWTHKKIAGQFGICRSHVGNILAGHRGYKRTLSLALDALANTATA